MGMVNGRGILEIQADLEPVRAAIPVAEAALAEAEPKVQPALDRWMGQRAVLEAAGRAVLDARADALRMRGRLEVFASGVQTGRYTDHEINEQRQRAAEAERFERAAGVAEQAYELAKGDDRRAQKAFNAANLAAHHARQHLARLRHREEGLAHELAKAERKQTGETVAEQASRGWLATLRERAIGAA